MAVENEPPKEFNVVLHDIDPLVSRAWCQKMMDSLVTGGVWALKRSGLIFQKMSPIELVLISQMPHDPAMPITAEQLKEQQESDFRETKIQFGYIGVEVRRAEDAIRPEV